MQTFRKLKSYKALVIFSIITSSFFYSCTKIDIGLNEQPINNEEITNRFFATSAKTDPINFRIIEELKEINNRQEFITAFVKENGYPIWDKAIITTKTHSNNGTINSVTGQTDTIIQIPLVLPNTSKVNGFISAVINDSINYNLYIGKDYYKYSFNNVPEDSINADKAAMQIMLLDKAVFGYTDFAINDNRLFSNQNNYNINAPQRIIKISNNNGNIGNIIPVCESVIIDWVVLQCGFYDCTITWFQQINICPNYGGGSSGGTSGGGSPFPPPPGGTGIPCSGCGTGPSGSPNGTGSGGTGSGGLGWTPTPINPAIAYILTTLVLERDDNEAIWFGNSSHLTRAIEIQNYLVLNNNSAAAIGFCRQHLNLMMSDPIYLNFVASHHTTGNQNKMWWEDEVWLRQIKFLMPETAFNFYMKNTRPSNQKPEEFVNRCEGLKAIAQRTKADPLHERLGYITYDRKFILTDIGGNSNVNLNLRGKGNSLYYAYPLSLGMPSQTYYGTIIDTDLQEVWILVRASVHTHTEGGGVSIDFPNARSEEDLRAAYKTFNISPSFKNFVIEPFGNTYKTGQFDADDLPNEYFDTHSGLSLADICQFITP